MHGSRKHEWTKTTRTGVGCWCVASRRVRQCPVTAWVDPENTKISTNTVVLNKLELERLTKFTALAWAQHLTAISMFLDPSSPSKGYTDISLDHYGAFTWSPFSTDERAARPSLSPCSVPVRPIKPTNLINQKPLLSRSGAQRFLEVMSWSYQVIWMNVLGGSWARASCTYSSPSSCCLEFWTLVPT